MALLSFLNLYTAYWDSEYSSVKFSNALSSVIFSILMTGTLILAAILCCSETNGAQFSNRFGALTDGIETEKRSKGISVMVLFIFLLRRLAVVLSIVVL